VYPFNADAAQALNQAVNLFLEIGRLNMAARYSKVNKVSFPGDVLTCSYLCFFTSGNSINELK
jgi:hypothetical protein